MSLTQMVNTRKGGGINQLARIRRRRAVPNPETKMNPSSNPLPTGNDVVIAAQVQLLLQMANTMAEMQAQIH
jgi:hypothetical protein